MTTDDIKMIIDGLKFCPIGHPEVVRKFEYLLETIESVQIAIMKSPSITGE